MKQLILCILLVVFPVSESFCQKLNVRKSEVTRVYRKMQPDHALVIFETGLKDLTITPVISDEEIVREEHRGRNVYFIETDLRANTHGVYNDRTYLLRSSESEEYMLEIKDMVPKNVYFYTVVLPPQFPLIFTCEYLFDLSSKGAIRIAGGKRFGGYLCYKWGDYYPAGVNIDEYMKDADVLSAFNKGGIRIGITGGLRLGLFRKWVPTYLYVGGGYGEYGRQWENKFEVNDNIYFHSDYIKGFEGEIGLSFVILDILNISAGVDMIVGGGRISTDFQVGLGVAIQSAWFRK